MGRGSYDTTGVKKPAPKPKPKRYAEVEEELGGFEFGEFGVNWGRGSYDTTGVKKPKPKPK